MSITAEFAIQFEALLRGLQAGEAEYLKSEITEATEEWLTEVFGHIQSTIQRLAPDKTTYSYTGALNYTGETESLTQKWIADKNKVMGRNRSDSKPYLWRGTSRKRGRTSLIDLLDGLSESSKTGKALFFALGGITAEASVTGSNALRPGIRISGYTGKPYDVRNKKYVSWAQAVTPMVNEYLKQAAVMPVEGVSINQKGGKVSVPGQRGQISMARAIANGLLRAGISVSYLDKLGTFLGPKSNFDDLADVLYEADLLGDDADYQRSKFNGLHRQGHGILTPVFAQFFVGTGAKTLKQKLKDKGIGI